MRTLVLIVALSSAACLRQTEFKCSTSAECSATGAVCEANGYCSFVDPNCASGRRFGDLSGSVANQCVGGNAGVDAGVDAATTDGGSGCPGTYTALSGQVHRYRKITGTATWMAQVAACSADGANAYLTVPNDMTELQALVTAGNVARLWVGIDDQMTEGTYVTTRGGTIAATDPMWDLANGEPDNQPFQGPPPANCVVAQMSNKLADDACTKTYPAICECEP